MDSPPLACSFTSKPGWARGFGLGGGGEKEDRHQLAGGWASTLSFLPRLPTLLHGAGPRVAALLPVPAVCPVSSARASSVNTCPCNKKGLSRCQRSYYLSIKH